MFMMLVLIMMLLQLTIFEKFNLFNEKERHSIIKGLDLLKSVF